MDAEISTFYDRKEMGTQRDCLGLHSQSLEKLGDWFYSQLDLALALWPASRILAGQAQCLEQVLQAGYG